MTKQDLRKKAIKLIAKNEELFFLLKHWRLKMLMFFEKGVSDEKYIRRQYKHRTGKTLDLDNPTLYNEKVQHAKLYYRDERLKKLVDKYEVRDYISKTIGDQYLTKLYGVYSSVDEIPFADLPDKFALKLTNGSGYNYICTHKTPNEIKKIKRRFKQWLKVDFYMLGREWAYKDVPNRIICEEYLESDETYGLNDYKVFCFDGIPKIIQVDYARFTAHKRNLYTPEWEFVNEKVAYENDVNANIQKPEKLEEMLECARKLSKNFPHVRVDFYSIGNRLVFGEMTFYHGAGYLHFEHEEFEKKMGSYWELNNELSTFGSYNQSK